jgi:hypothetical protein
MMAGLTKIQACYKEWRSTSLTALSSMSMPTAHKFRQKTKKKK